MILIYYYHLFCLLRIYSKKLEWQLKGNLFYFKGKLYILPEVLYQEVVWLNYDNPHIEHFEYLCILELIPQKYYWLRISRDIKEYINSYNTCHQIKPVKHKYYGTLNFFSISSQSIHLFNNRFYYKYAFIWILRHDL